MSQYQDVRAREAEVRTTAITQCIMEFTVIAT